MARPTRTEIHMRTAMLWAERSSCLVPERKIGAVITSWDFRRILAVGYNGPSRGNECTYKGPEGLTVVGSSRCQCLHAECNAIAHLRSHEGGHNLFVTMAPCVFCAGLIVNAEIVRVVFRNEYRSPEGFRVLDKAGISVEQMIVD